MESYGAFLHDCGFSCACNAKQDHVRNLFPFCLKKLIVHLFKPSEEKSQIVILQAPALHLYSKLDQCQILLPYCLEKPVAKSRFSTVVARKIK